MLEASIDEYIFIASLAIGTSSLAALVLRVLCIDIGPSLSRPRILEAFGLGNVRLILRF